MPEEELFLDYHRDLYCDICKKDNKFITIEACISNTCLKCSVEFKGGKKCQECGVSLCFKCYDLEQVK